MTDWMSTPRPDAPVLVFAFANDRVDHTAGYLRDLVRERRAIERAIEPARLRGWCHAVVEANVTLSGLFDVLDTHHDHVVAVHYGGHATNDALMVEDDAGRPRPALAEGLAARLGRLPRLALVFLNGCSTHGHVDELQRHCRAAVVATDRSVDDAAAADFARRLYHALGAGRSIAEAFASAEAELAAAYVGPSAVRRARMLAAVGDDEDEAGWPWRLYAPDGAPDAVEWRLRARRSRRRAWLAGLAAGLALAGGVGWWTLGPDPVPSDAVDAGAAGGIGAGERAPGSAAAASAREVAAATASRPALWAIPAGRATIGRSAEAAHDAPLRVVQIERPLWVSETPITRAQYRAVMRREPPSLGDEAPADDAPVTGLDLTWVRTYCARLSEREGISGEGGYRLPTEEEWEYICRAGRTSDPVGEPAGASGLARVGGPANPWGVRDLLGTVAEWTASPYRHPDAPGADAWGRMVVRGGSYRSPPDRVRCSARDKVAPGRRSAAIGFRVVRTAPAP